MLPDPALSEAVVGREWELAAIDRLLEALPDGGHGLVLEGEPGIGKTTVWREVFEPGPAGPVGPAGPKGDKGDKGSNGATSVTLRTATGPEVGFEGVSNAQAELQ